MEDFDDYDISDLADAGDFSDGSMSTIPVKIYAAVAIVSLLIYYGRNLFKNGKLPGLSSFFSNLCCICVCASIVACLCVTNKLAGWLLAIVLSMCAICVALGYVPTFGMDKLKVTK